jgi:hypothetical protein
METAATVAAAEPAAPDAFIKIVTDMTADLSATFPEKAHLWDKWTSVKLDELPHRVYVQETETLFEFCRNVCAEHFFSILYQDADLFDAPGRAEFLPGVDFADLFHCEGVSDNTRAALWNYIRLIAFTVAGDLGGLAGDDMGSKLADAAREIETFFATQKSTEPIPATAAAGPAGVPEPAGPMDGKLGALARDVADEIGGEFADMMGGAECANISDVMQKLMKNPAKLASLVQTVSSKLNDKVGSGDISNDELMREAAQFMKGMGAGADGMGGAPFQDIMKTVTQAMAGMGGLGGLRPSAPPAAPGAPPAAVCANKWSDKVKQRAATKKAVEALKAIAPAAHAPAMTDAALDDILVAALADSVGPANVRKERADVAKATKEAKEAKNKKRSKSK